MCNVAKILWLDLCDSPCFAVRLLVDDSGIPYSLIHIQYFLTVRTVRGLPAPCTVVTSFIQESNYQISFCSALLLQWFYISLLVIAQMWGMRYPFWIFSFFIKKKVYLISPSRWQFNFAFTLRQHMVDTSGGRFTLFFIISVFCVSY